jgi:hypothetical protein
MMSDLDAHCVNMSIPDFQHLAMGRQVMYSLHCTHRLCTEWLRGEDIDLSIMCIRKPQQLLKDRR